MDLNLKTKGVLIAVAVCALVMASILSATPIVKPAYAVAWCQNHKSKSENWKDGCTTGVSDCRGGKSYHPGSHTRQFHLGYDAGYTHVCGYQK